MTEAELRHAVGDRVYDAFAPRGMLTQHDAEDPDNLAFLGTTPEGEEVEINKRAAESDLLVYVNINLVAMDGGWKSTATGLASYRSLRHHHNPETMQASRSFMDQHRSELHKSNWRMGKVLVDSGVKVFQIETTLNTDTFPSPFDFMAKREWEWTARDRATYVGTTASLKRTPTRLARKIFMGIEAPHQMTSRAGRRGRRGAQDHAPRTSTASSSSRSQGQTDILTMGIPFICPYNVNSIMNPILVMCMGLGYLFNMYRGKPLVREGGVVIMTHPTPVGLPPRAPPELHRLLRAGAVGDHRPARDERQVRGALRQRRVVPPPVQDQLRLPRRAPVLHVVLGRARDAALRQGHHRRRRRAAPCAASASPRPRRWTTRSRSPATSSAALPRITHLHTPPIMVCDVK